MDVIRLDDFPLNPVQGQVYEIIPDKTRIVASTNRLFNKYPTRYIPAVPRFAIRAYSQQGDTVLDPFCGSGTTAIEAMRLGRNALSLDIDPFARLLIRVKTAVSTYSPFWTGWSGRWRPWTQGALTPPGAPICPTWKNGSARPRSGSWPFSRRPSTGWRRKTKGSGTTCMWCWRGSSAGAPMRRRSPPSPTSPPGTPRPPPCPPSCFIRRKPSTGRPSPAFPGRSPPTAAPVPCWRAGTPGRSMPAGRWTWRSPPPPTRLCPQPAVRGPVAGPHLLPGAPEQPGLLYRHRVPRGPPSGMPPRGPLGAAGAFGRADRQGG